MSDRPISDYPDWFTASADVQEATIAEDFNQVFGKTEHFLKADPATQEQYRLAHRQLVEEAALKSEHNPLRFEQIRDQARTDEGSFLGNFTRTLKRSHEDTLSRGLMVDDVVVPGSQLDPDFAAQTAAYIAKRNAAPITEERKQLAQDMAKWQKNTEHGTFWDKTKATATLVKDIATNPGGVMDVAAESAASMSVIGAGAAAGSAVGAGVTAATGGLAAPIAPAFTAAGMWGAETVDAATSKFQEKIQGRLQAAGIEPTQSNIQMFLDKNPEIVAQDKQDSMAYGGILGAVDIALGGFFSKLATLPTRAARKAALASAEAAPARAMLAEAAQATGKPLEELTEDYVNRLAADALDARTFRQKLGTAAGAYAGEIASEPASEAVATAAIGEQNTAENLIYETLGGIGAGPYGAAINTAALGTKLAANKTGEFTQKLLASTPETKATVAAQEEAFEQAKRQSRAAAEYQYKKTVAETAPDDAKVDDWANPEHPDYSPIKAVEILAKAQDTDVTALDKARGVANNMMAEIQGIFAKIDAVEEQQNAARTAGDKGKVLLLDDELKRLSDTLEYKAATREKVMVQVDQMKNKAIAAAQTKEIKPINLETATPEEITEHITESIGSHGNKNAATNEGIQTLLKRPDITSEQRTLLSDTLKANVARQQVEESAKSMGQVANDIYHGMHGSEFKGIDSYVQGVTHYLQKGDTEAAQKQLDGLKKFRDAHQLKSERTAHLFEQFKIGGLESFTPEQNKLYEQMKRENKKFFVNSSTGALVRAEAQEVNALNLEVTRAESLMRLKTAPTPAAESLVVKSTLSETPMAEEPVQEAPNPAEEPVLEPTQTETKTEEVAASEPAITAEHRDTAGLLNLLGIENEADPNYTPTYDDIMTARQTLVDMVKTGNIDSEQLASAFKWLHTKDVKLSNDRYERATYKTYDQATGERFSDEQVAKNKEKFDKRSKGNTRAYLALQVAEELGEMAEEHLQANQVEATDPRYAELEVKKRGIKVARFGGDTVINDKTSPYHGMTNRQAYELAKKNVEATPTKGDQTNGQVQAEEERNEGREEKVVPATPVATPKPARKSKPKAKSFRQDIIDAGGVSTESFNVALDRKMLQGSNTFGILRKDGRGLDEIAVSMQEKGWNLPEDEYGKVDMQAFTEMLREELSGNKQVHPDDAVQGIEDDRPAPIDTSDLEAKKTKLHEKVRKARKAGKDTTELFQQIAEINQQIAVAEEHNQMFAEPVFEEEAAAPVVEADVKENSTDEINPSTLDSNTDNLTTIEDLDLDALSVTFTDTDGTEQTKPYREAAQELQTRITEAENILRCFAAS